MKIAVSACLLGYNCKYNGKNNYNANIAALSKEHTLIPVCPEMEGGLSCPRSPCEIIDDKVISNKGRDCTYEYEKGAQVCLEKIQKEGCQKAILQPRSPSCGVYQIYDGSFSGKLIDGEGIFARKLKEAGIETLEA